MNTSFLFRIAVMAIIVSFAMSLTRGGETQRAESEIAYSDFLSAVRSGQVERVVIEGQRVAGTRAGGSPFTTYAPDDSGLMGDLLDAGVAIEARPPERPGLLSNLFVALFPVLLLIGFWIWFMRRQMGAGGKGGPLSFGRSTARRIEGEKVSVRFADVAGVDEAKEDVGELVEFLRDPSRFRALGGNIPRGVLMSGPPGTGKTLMARAIAGEAGVPFFTASGSDFVEMFVGVGASRVRDLFAQATKNAPCIVFIDEIDAVGRRRGAGMGGGNDEREQTLNQILVEMDGFEGNEGVIVIAATNRPDVLDPALLRPGRFDRQVVVPLPDVIGRAQILKVHMRKVPVANDVDAAIIARGTPGFSGADLANLVNEAALMAGRAGHTHVEMELFEKAKDKLLMGAERRSLVMSEQDRERTAYHEAGHTIIGRLVPEHDPVHKVSIIPRGRALGVTVFLPERDRYSASRRRLESEICALFGGRVAEELVYGADAVTTGAQNDIQRATQIARDMVTKYGLSGALGPLAYEEPEEPVFLGQPSSQRPAVSEETARSIDREVRAIIDRNYARAAALLEENRDTLTRIAEALVLHETLDSDQIDALMSGARVPDPVFDMDEGPGPGTSDTVSGRGQSPRPTLPATEH